MLYLFLLCLWASKKIGLKFQLMPFQCNLIEKLTHCIPQLNSTYG